MAQIDFVAEAAAAYGETTLPALGAMVLGHQQFVTAVWQLNKRIWLVELLSLGW